MAEMDALCDRLDKEHKNVHVLLHRDPNAKGGFKGGSKRKDSWFVTRFDELLKSHGPKFDAELPYMQNSPIALLTWLNGLYPEYRKNDNGIEES
jgi:hypothetical protein